LNLFMFDGSLFCGSFAQQQLIRTCYVGGSCFFFSTMRRWLSPAAPNFHRQALFHFRCFTRGSVLLAVPLCSFFSLGLPYRIHCMHSTLRYGPLAATLLVAPGSPTVWVFFTWRPSFVSTLIQLFPPSDRGIPLPHYFRCFIFLHDQTGNHFSTLSESLN